MNFNETIKNRRSVYSIGSNAIVPEAKIQEIVEYALKHSPAAFNSPNNKVVVLFKAAHEEIWETIKSALRKIVPAQNFASTEEKINSFKSGYGSVLFFRDLDAVTALQNNFPLYAENFPSWSEQASGMFQYAVWNMLEAEGLGASLQHYNVFIEKFVKEKYSLPNGWCLMSQMPFGNVVTAPDEKKFNDLKGSIKVVG